MEKKRIKYFSYKGCWEDRNYRENSPAADTKIDYIIGVLNRCDYVVDHISRAGSSSERYLPGSVENIGENSFRYFASFPKTTSVFRVFCRWFMELQFFIWCLLNIKKDETILVYHSLGYASTFVKLRKFKHFKIIGEIEEIYQDVHAQSKSKSKSEYDFIKLCDSYIFPTVLMDNKLNLNHKKSVIVHGVYSISRIVEKKFDDGKIHVVYGGTLDPQKGGAVTAATAAEFLPENYHIHICGFGDAEQIKGIISKVSSCSQATLSFEGNLKGEDYIRFIQKCHIGLSTQNPNAAFNDTSFPSKILVYLSNGLKVVSVRIPVVEQSLIADNIFFYNSQTPSEIAHSIKCASHDEYVDNKEFLLKLDNQFVDEIKIMFEKD